jgi:hypothetical protein
MAMPFLSIYKETIWAVSNEATEPPVGCQTTVKCWSVLVASLTPQEEEEKKRNKSILK